MALNAGPKTRHLTPLPPRLPPVEWVTEVLGEAPYPWQAEVLSDLAVGSSKRPRKAYVQVARKNGKTRLAALLALYEVCCGDRRHVYAISDSERNVNSVLMLELRDLIGGCRLRDSVHIFTSHIEVPETGSFIQARPNNFRASQGINPHLVIFDEVHLQRSDETLSGMQMAGAARPDALLFAVTTPGYDLASPAHDLYQAVKAGDPSIYGRIFEADPAADIDDRVAWAEANPCYGRRGFAEALEFDRGNLPEHEFRRFRLGQWTATDKAWLPHGAWDACALRERDVGDGERVWLGFDGSYSQDSTALVGATADRHVFVVGAWENPGRPGWRVPRDQVQEAVAGAFARYEVVMMACDPPYWEAEIAAWSARWPGRVSEFRTGSRARIAPACTSFYAGVMERTLTHDGNRALARHIANAVVKATPYGDVITKAQEHSPAKIDLAVAAVVAHSEAALHQPVRRSAVFVL